MKQFTLKLASLLCILLFGGGSLSAQTLTKITSLAEIDGASKYVLKYNGNAYGGDSFYKNYKTACYFYYNGSAMATTTTSPSGDNSYYFTLEADAGNNTLKIKSLTANKYLSATSTISLVDASSGTNIDWSVEMKNSNFFIYCLSGVYWRFMVGYYASSSSTTIQTQSAGSGGANKKDNMYCIEIYKVPDTKTASFYYYDENKNLLNSTAYDVNLSSTSSDNTLSKLTKKYPAYISATYYSDDSFAEDKKVSDSYEVTGNETFHVITSYNEKFLYPTNSDTYFALATSGIFLGKETNGSSITYANRENFALRLKGDWYNNYQILKDETTQLDGSNTYNITWKENSDYRWEIDDNGYIKDITSDKYLSIGSSNCIMADAQSSKVASTEAAATILKGMTAEYVGQYDESHTGSVTFDDLVKGNNALDFTNGTYYFVEKATDASSLLSANPETTYGAAADAGAIAMSTQNFSGLWKYEDGKFVHANSGLKLTGSEVDKTGATWSKAATGTDCVYTLSDGTNNLTVSGNSDWKFRIANSMTIALTVKDGKSYATTCAPVPVTLSESDAENTTLYIEKSHTENKISLDKAEAVAANTGIYIENTNAATSVTLLFAESGATSEAKSPILAGTTMQLTLPADRTDYRTLGFNKSGEIGFFKPAASIAAIPANRAFLYLNGMSLTNAFYIDFDGTTTSIDELLPDADALDSNAPIYDLSGRRMQGTLHKGIYIQNGRKFIVK